MLRRLNWKCFVTSELSTKAFERRSLSTTLITCKDDERLHSGVTSGAFTFNYDSHEDSTIVLPSQSQIVIAGAGTVANSVAYHLVINGYRDVLVLEQNKIGAGTSHFGSGTLGLFKPISHRNLISYSIKLYRQLQEMGYEIGLRQCGSINLAQTKDRMVALKRRMAYNVPTGLYCEVRVTISQSCSSNVNCLIHCKLTHNN